MSKFGIGRKSDTIEISKKHKDKKFQILTSIVIPILVSFGCIFLAAHLNYLDWQNQISFDKHGAANQLFTEIDSMNESLAYHAYQYMNCYDFSIGGNSVPIDLKKNLILRVHDENGTRRYGIDAIRGSFTMYKIDGKPVRKNGSLMMDYNEDVNNVNRKINEKFKYGNNNFYIDNLRVLSATVVVDNPIIPGPLYSDHGMYYVYQKDIFKFNETLSKDLYVFYNYITRAESDRQYIQNYFNLYPNGKLNGQYFDAYMDMRINILYAAKMAPNILKELDREKDT